MQNSLSILNYREVRTVKLVFHRVRGELNYFEKQKSVGISSTLTQLIDLMINIVSLFLNMHHSYGEVQRRLRNDRYK